MSKPRRRKDGTFRPGSSGNPSGLPAPRLDDVALRSGVAPDGQMPDANRLDSWSSALTGIGQWGRDKRLGSTFCAAQLDYLEAVELWRGDDIAARAIESVPSECFRQGYEITISDEGSFEDLKEDVEERLHEIGADRAIQKAFEYERAYGGGAILLGVDDSCSLDEPMVPERVRSVEWLTVLEPIELMPYSYYDNPEAPKYGDPEFYSLNTTSSSSAGIAKTSTPSSSSRAGQLIHESRLIVFGGNRVSRYQRVQSTVSPMWGDSILIRLVSVLRDFNVAWSSAGIIATDFAQSVITIENLKAIAARDPKKLADRMAALELGRSTARAIILDTNEKYQRQSTTLTGFPDLLNGLSMRLAAAVDMPLTLLMGQSPKGLGNEGDSDVRFYYDRIKGIQTRRISPILRLLAGMIMKSIRQRKLPKKWGIRFNPLWQLTDHEKAEARLTQARADSMYIKMGAVSCNEIRRSRFVGEYSWETQVDESARAPGIPYPPAAMGAGPAPGSPTEPGGPDGEPSKKGARGAVSGYVRRPPTSKSPMGSDATEGGDVAAEAGRRDEDGAGEVRIFAGLEVVVESPKGSVREWTDSDGSVGQTKMRYDYGYVRGTMGADLDSVDVYLGPSPSAEWAYVVHQNSKSDNFESYDEDKVMLGFDSPNHARDAYLRQYDDERFYGGMTILSLADFAQKIANRSGKVTNADGEVADELLGLRARRVALAAAGELSPAVESLMDALENAVKASYEIGLGSGDLEPDEEICEECGDLRVDGEGKPHICPAASE